MSLWTTLDLLRSSSHLFPTVDLKYDPDSATSPIILHLRPHLDLLFSGFQQRLQRICLKKLGDPHPPVRLGYKGRCLSGPGEGEREGMGEGEGEVLRRVGVSKAFGPTYPGEDLVYPGVWFSFREDGGWEASTSPGAEDKMQEVKRVIVSQKNDSEDEREDVLSEVRECQAMLTEIQEAVIKVRLVFLISSPPSTNYITPPSHLSHTN